MRVRDGNSVPLPIFGNPRRQQEVVFPMLFDVAYSGDKDKLYKTYKNGDDVNLLVSISIRQSIQT